MKKEKPYLASADPIWHQLRAEAQVLSDAEPALGLFIYTNILSHETLEQAVMSRVASWLEGPDLSADQIRRLYVSASRDEDEVGLIFRANLPAARVRELMKSSVQNVSELGLIFRADLAAVLERDPACTRAIEPFLYYKGFAALQSYRLAHMLWHKGRKDFALMIQMRMCSVLNVDIHPGAIIGRGIMLDHASGCVFGETVVIEDNVSILHNVTLGGTSAVKGSDRHPKIRSGVLIGAGAKILGNIEIGECSRVAASSVVLDSVPPHTTVAGVPARIVGDAGCAEPSRNMNHHFTCDFQI